MRYKLTEKQFEAARLIATGELASDITKRLKLRKHTLTRWRRIPAFMDAVEQHISEVEDALTYKLRFMRYSSARKLHSNTVYNDEMQAHHTLKLLDVAQKFLDTNPSPAGMLPKLPEIIRAATKDLDAKLQAIDKVESSAISLSLWERVRVRAFWNIRALIPSFSQREKE